jgi:hypothetical protein
LYPATEVPGLSTFCEFAHLSSWLIYDGFCTKYHVLCGGYIIVFLHVIDSYNDREHLHNGLLYFDTPIKDYVYTWNIIAANYTETESCCYG